MYRKRTILLAALAGLGLFLSGCCNDPCGGRRSLFNRTSRPCCSSPVVEAGCCGDTGCCHGAPVSYGEGPSLGMPGMTAMPPPVYTNGNGTGGSMRLVPQPQAPMMPYMP